jgi:prolyl oligopeptidase
VDNAFAIQVNGGGAVQLTGSTDTSIQVQSYFPDDDRFLYLADHQGNEMDQLYVRELDGTSIDLTSGKDHQVRFLGWAQDGLSLFISTKETRGFSISMRYRSMDMSDPCCLKTGKAMNFNRYRPTNACFLSSEQTNARTPTSCCMIDRHKSSGT